MSTKIYLVENCYDDPNKVYIGKTINSRKSSHKKTFGENIVYSEIDEINSLDVKHWKPLETYWINQFKVWGFNVLNDNEGGGGPPKGRKIRPKDQEWKNKIGKANKGKILSEETKQKMSLSKQGKSSPFLNKTHTLETKQKISKNNKGISRGKGKIVSKETKNKISRSHKGIKTHTVPHSSETKQKLSKIKSKPVLQYTKNEEFIKRWNSAKEAEIALGITLGDISRVCRGLGKTCKNYKWKWEKI